MDPSSLSSSPKKPVILKDGDNVNEIAKRNLLASTVLTALLGYSVHRPNIVLFFFGWPGSELVHIWMTLQACNLFYLTKKYPNLFHESYLAKAALGVNAWAFSYGATSLWEALNARNVFSKELRAAGIQPRAGQSTSEKISALLSLIPLFYISRRGKSIRIERNIPYASIKDLDPSLLEQWKRVPRVVRNILMIGRGRISQWMSLDVIRLDDDQMKNAPVLCAIHGGGWAVADKIYSAHALLNRIASRGIIVCAVNYRMSPERAWPTHIQDCKRALIFLKRNVQNWGGDPNKIFVTGESAGGHLSSLMGVTANFPEFQPPEDPMADTSVAGTLPLYGVHDWTNSNGHSFEMPIFTSQLVIQKPISSKTWTDFEKASPIWHVQEKLKSGADPKLSPFFIPHGTHDVLAPYKDAKEMFLALRELRLKFPLPNGQKDVFVTLSHGHHAFGYFPSLRSNALGDAMADFIFHHSSLLSGRF